MPSSRYEFETCIDFELSIGESPVWDSKRRSLWFVDVTRPALFNLDAETNDVATYDMPEAVGSIGLCSDGRLVVALRNGVHFFDPSTKELEFLVHPEPLMTMNRLNDGKVGPDGAFWVGSMHDFQPRVSTASLYRVLATGEVETVLQNLKVSNGLAWSPDGKTMYHSDSRGPHVRAFDFDPQNGRISNDRTLISLDEENGLPDGAAVDINGNYWSAGVSAGVLNVFSSDGTLIERVHIPTLAPTMPCFGGSDMKTMYVTSLTATREGKKTLGTLLRTRVEVPGVEVGRMTVSSSSKSQDSAKRNKKANAL